MTPVAFYREFAKRGLDLALVVATLPLWGPVSLLVAAAVRSASGSPVLFRQRRPGRHGSPFILYKFRTMTDQRDERGELLPDGLRLTRLGRWLRSWSLDELPQLWNVLRGDLSLVGPRPLLLDYLGRYNAEQARRHEVRPGLTGWAQVHGRNAVTWEERLRFDVWYAENCSLGLDVKILAMTLWRVFRREGISAAGRATMTEFRGTEK